MAIPWSYAREVYGTIFVRVKDRIDLNKIRSNNYWIILWKSTFTDKLKEEALFSSMRRTRFGKFMNLSYIVITGSDPRVKRSGCGVDHPPACNTNVIERVELYLSSSMGLYGLFEGVL
jgi:hypothetical protein